MTNTPKIKDNCEHCKFGAMCSHQQQCQVASEPLIDHVINLKRRESLYSYRDDFKCVYAVRRGAIKTYQIGVDGVELIQQFYLPGEIIGLDAISLGYYPYSAMALVDSSVCVVAFDNLLNATAGYPLLQREMIDIMSQQINAGDYVAAPTADQRVAAFLLDMYARSRSTYANDEIELSMSRYDIGNYLGLAPETISRILTKFQQHNLIIAQHKLIKFLDRDKLLWIAQEGSALDGA